MRNTSVYVDVAAAFYCLFVNVSFVRCMGVVTTITIGRKSKENGAALLKNELEYTIENLNKNTSVCSRSKHKHRTRPIVWFLTTERSSKGVKW